MGKDLHSLSHWLCAVLSEHTIVKVAGRDCHIALHTFNEYGVYSLVNGRGMDEPTAPEQPDG